jgi:large subunit ribosomal protein L21e
MVKRSLGKMSKRTKILGKSAKKLTASQIVKEYQIGQKVVLVPHPSYPKGFFHPKFKGKIGTIIQKKGRGYDIEIFDGNKRKIISTTSEHIKAI